MTATENSVLGGSARRRQNAGRAVLWLAALALALLVVFPIWYMLVMSLAPTSKIISNQVGLLPQGFDIANYRLVFAQIPLLRQLFNTLFVSAVTLALQLLIALLAAYAFAFLRFKGREVLFWVILSTMMIPDMTTVISNYLMVSEWHWSDTYQALILPYAASALGIFLLRQYFRTMAAELREAATIDGCGHLRFLFLIAAPLSRPMLAAFGVTAFLGSWNMYMWPLLVTNKATMRMVQVGVASLMDRDTVLAVGVAIAGAAVVTLPSLLLFLIGNKQLVRGMMAGAVKG